MFIFRTARTRLLTSSVSIVLFRCLLSLSSLSVVFCLYRPCPLFSYRCQNGQGIDEGQLCNVNPDFYDGSDEAWQSPRQTLKLTTLPPAVLEVDFKGQPFLRQMKDSDECPVTHIQCFQGFCLPIYFRCNGVDDCPNREDEISCETYICSGFYRCRGSKVCLCV